MKNNILSVLIFISGMICGGFLALQYTPKDAPAPAASMCMASSAPAPELGLVPLSQATLPPDVSEAEETQAAQPRPASQVPSHLVRNELPEGIVLGVKPEETTAIPGVVLADEPNTVVLPSKVPAAHEAEGSSRTMIEAPVAVKRISSLNDYKAFKRIARGSYPAADFTKEEVFVLESQSNLPDKSFEIVEIIPAEKEITVLYRVNLLGLDKKTNTHSAKTVGKTKLPVVLKQVL